MKRVLTTGVLGAAVFLSSCAGLTEQEQRAFTGSAIGAGAGALIGAISGNAGTGALIGAGVGLASGLIVDHQRQQEQAAYERGVQTGRQQAQQEQQRK